MKAFHLTRPSTNFMQIEFIITAMIILSIRIFKFLHQINKMRTSCCKLLTLSSLLNILHQAELEVYKYVKKRNPAYLRKRK